MTSIETTPLLNQAVVTVRQNQIIVSRPDLPENLPSTFSPLNRNMEILGTDQVDIPGIAGMAKYINAFKWNLSSAANSTLMTYELTISNLLTLAPFGTSIQTVMNAQGIELELINTNNAMYQGSLLVYVDPSPTPDYWTSVFNDALTLYQKFQFPMRFLIEPKTRNPIKIFIPINIPLDMFQFYYNAADVSMSNYVNSYSFGRLRVDVNVPLETKSATTFQNFRLTGRLVGFQTAGTRFT